MPSRPGPIDDDAIARIARSVPGSIVRQAFDRAISVLVNDGTNGVLNLNVQSNNLAVSSDPLGSRESSFLNNASTTTNVFGQVEGATVRLNRGGAGALANTLTHGVGAPDDFRIRQRFNSRIEMPGYGGTASNAAAVVTHHIQGRNTGSAGEPGSATATNSVSVTTDGFFNGAVPPPNTATMTLDISGNTFTGLGGAEDIRVRQRDTAVFRVEGMGTGQPNDR